MNALTIYIGYDPREKEAFDVAADSCKRHASVPVDIVQLNAHKLYTDRLLWRPVEEVEGQKWDHLSAAPQSTEFSTSRFLIPYIHRGQWALFIDCDMVFLGDVAELFALADPQYAVMCVKHHHVPRETSKMDGQIQTAYERKNWSSVVLWNCAHPGHYRLPLASVNHWPGILLHRFSWLKDEEIGELPPAWNWLVGCKPKPADVKLAHFTLGSPALPGWKQQPHDEIYLEARARLRGS